MKGGNSGRKPRGEEREEKRRKVMGGQEGTGNMKRGNRPGGGRGGDVTGGRRLGREGALYPPACQARGK